MNAPVVLHLRKRFTRSQRRAILADQRGACACCGVSLDIEAGDRVEIDHDIPLALGGTNARGNLRALCQPCHAEKTPGDVTVIAKAKRVGALGAERATAAGVEAVVFDRGGNKYHGRVAAIADGAREGGLAL